MASYNELNALIDAYINRNGVQAITGQILNGVLKAMVEQLGRGYTIMGAATPTTDPGTPDSPESWFAATPGIYTNFGGLEVGVAELAFLSYSPTADAWIKDTLTKGIDEVEVTLDNNVGTPSATSSYSDGVLTFAFHNLKGDPGQPGEQGEQGAPGEPGEAGQPGQAAGFGAVSATVDGNIGIPSVEVTSSGPDTAKVFSFSFHNLKGEPGIQGPVGPAGVDSCFVTVDNTTGLPTCTVSLVGGVLTLAFTGLKGAQGDTGSSVDYPFTIVNNLTTNDATQALSAAMGVQLEAEVSQLEAEVHNLSGRFYGVFDDDSDLPEEGDAVGYAFVGTEEPLTLFTFDGSDWTDTEILISGIVGPQGEEGPEGPQGIQGPPGVTSAEVTVDNTSGTPSAIATVVDGVLSLHLSGIKGIQGDTGVSADYPITIANNLSTDDPTSALAASQGVVLKGEIEQANAAIKEPFNEGVYGYVWKKGTVNDYHQYTQISNTRICMCFPAETPLSFKVASGYFASIHCYSQIFTDVTQITSGSSWLGNIDSSWKSGTVSVAPLTGTKTYFILVKKGDAGTSTVSPSEGLVAVTDIYIKQSLQDEITKLKANDSVEKGFNGVWLQGSLSGTNAYSSSYSNRIITTFPCTGLITIRLAAGYKVAIHSYSVSYDNASEITNGTYYIESLTSGGWVEDGLTVKQSANGKTFVIIVAKTDDSNIVPSESSDGVLSIVGQIPFIDDYDELAVSVRGYERLWRNDKPTITWKQGSLSNSHAYMNMSTRIIAAVPWAGSLDIVVATGYYVSIHCYSQIFTDATQITSGSSWLGNIDSSWKEGTVRVSQLPSGLTYVLIVKKGSAGTDTIAPSDASTAITALVGEDIKVEGLIDRVGTDTGSYVWSADCLKRGVTVKQIGTLQYLQAFCVYGNKYYSTNGSAIAEQDVLFNVLRDVSINVGHGNSLQLVSGGKAWASGWDDQKMYRVDLSTLAVDNTITLPTTGYTTAAVDEDNGLMYIFQRDSYPSSIAQYNFIKYDYANEQIISTRKIESFAAMQGIDLYEGKILMLYGLGTSSAPCGMRIYNTAGDVLATFDLAIFASTESECIMFERDTRKILVSDVNKKIYEVVD